MQPFHRKPLHAQPSSTMPFNSQPTFVPDPSRLGYSMDPAPQFLNANRPPASGSIMQQPYSSRRTFSNVTSSTSSTGANVAYQSQPPPPVSAHAGTVRRSTSSRSNASASPTSYVALMRKQKATVWCDRAQQEDPRLLAAQRQAKMRAAMEVAGGHHHPPVAGRSNVASSSITGGVRSKIRHHGAPKARDYNAGNLSGAGVPMRLSASEVDEGDSEDDPRHHQRTSSGRSSLGSVGQRAYGHLAANRGHGNDFTPPSAVSPVESMGDLMEEETPMPDHFGNQSQDYFGQSGGAGGSGSSGEAEASFGSIGGLPQTRHRADTYEGKTSEELRRRGSVDDRTMTMGGGRLFVANPDLSD